MCVFMTRTTDDSPSLCVCVIPPEDEDGMRDQESVCFPDTLSRYLPCLLPPLPLCFFFSPHIPVIHVAAEENIRLSPPEFSSHCIRPFVFPLQGKRGDAVPGEAHHGVPSEQGHGGENRAESQRHRG